MTVGTIVHLDEHVGRIIRELFPTDDEAYLLCLTSQELSMVRQMCFPYLHYRTRFVDQLGEGAFRTADDASWLAYHQLVEDLEDTLGGCAMPCSDILTGLQALAAAIAAQPGCVNTLTCGSCGGSGAGGVLAPITGLPNEEIIPQTPITEPPTSGPPPEGFNSWEEYYDRKCKASHQLFIWIRGFLLVLQARAGAVPYIAGAYPIALVLCSGLGIVFPPAAVLAVAVGILALLVIASGALGDLGQAVTWLDTNKDDIICEFYHSGSALQVQTLALNALEDAVQAVEWGGLFAPLGPEIAAAIGAIAAAFVTNNMVNSIFYAVQDLELPDVTCDCDSMITEWHFDYGTEGWLYSENLSGDIEADGDWTNDQAGKDDNDTSAGRLRTIVSCGGGQFSYVNAQWSRSWAPGSQPVAHTGNQFIVDAYNGGSHANHRTLLLINYQEGGYELYQEGDKGWHTHTLGVGEPNDGKHVASIVVMPTMVGGQAGTWTWAFDKISVGFTFA